MASNVNALRAGALIIATSLVALGVVIVVSGPERFAAKEEYVAKFKLNQNLSGLKKNDEVRLGGVRVGSVSEIIIHDDPTNPSIDVSIRVPKKYTFHEGATVSVDAFVGAASLNIDSIGTGPSLAPGGTFSGSGGLFTKVGEMVPKVDGILTDVSKFTPKIDATITELQGLAIDAHKNSLGKFEQVATDAAAVLKKVRDALDPLVAKYGGVADEARQAAKNIGDFVGPSTGPATEDFHTILANFKKTTGKFDPIVDKFEKALTSLNDRLDQLKGTAEDLRTTLADTKDIAADVKAILVDNRPRIDRIISSVEGTANNAKAFTAEVLHRPSRLIWKDDEKTQGNLNVYFTAREFSEGAAELNDAAATLRESLRDPRLTSQDLKQRMELLNAAFDRFSEIQEKLYKSIK